AQRGDNDVGLKTGTIFAHTPAFVLRAALKFGQLQVLVRLAPSDIRRGREAGQMRAKDVVRPIAEQALGTGVPTGHVSGWIEHENRVVLHPFHEQAEAFLALLQGLLSALAFADVTEGQHNAGDVPGNVSDWRGAVVDGFEQVAKRLGCLGPLQRRVVSLAREINHRQTEAFAENPRGFDAVHLSFEPDIHEHQVRPRQGRSGQRFFSRVSNGGGLVAESSQSLLNVFGEEALVLHHKDACLFHTPRCLAPVMWRTGRTSVFSYFFEPSPGRWIGMCTPTVVPLPCRPMILTSPSSMVAR